MSVTPCQRERNARVAFKRRAILIFRSRAQLLKRCSMRETKESLPTGDSRTGRGQTNPMLSAYPVSPDGGGEFLESKGHS